MWKRWIGVLLAPFVVACQSGPATLQWRYEFEAGLENRTALLRASIWTGECQEAIDTPIWTAEFTPSDPQGPSPPLLETGVYSLSMTAFDADCRRVAEACESIDADNGRAAITLLLEGGDPVRTCASEACANGVCERGDGGAVSEDVTATVSFASPMLVDVHFDRQLMQRRTPYWRDRDLMGFELISGPDSYRVVDATLDGEQLVLRIAGNVGPFEELALRYSPPTNPVFQYADGERISAFQIAVTRLEFPDRPTVYYVSSSGDDSNEGTVPDEAWRTLAALSGRALPPGAVVLFERGTVYAADVTVELPGGLVSQPVVYGAYGEGARPILRFTGVPSATPLRFLQPSSHTVFRDLEVHGPPPSVGEVRLVFLDATSGRSADGIGFFNVRMQGGTTALRTDGLARDLVLRGVDIDAVDESGTRAPVGASCIALISHEASLLEDLRVRGCAEHGLFLRTTATAERSVVRRLDATSAGGSAVRIDRSGSVELADIHSSQNEAALRVENSDAEVVGLVSMGDRGIPALLSISSGARVTNFLLVPGRSSAALSVVEDERPGSLPIQAEYGTIIYRESVPVVCTAVAPSDCPVVLGPDLSHPFRLTRSIFVAPLYEGPWFALRNVDSLDESTAFTVATNIYDSSGGDVFARFGESGDLSVDFEEWRTIEPDAIMASTGLPTEVDEPSLAIPRSASSVSARITDEHPVATDLLGRTRHLPGASGALEAE